MLRVGPLPLTGPFVQLVAAMAFREVTFVARHGLFILNK
jgi:hypothetical protein